MKEIGNLLKKTRQKAQISLEELSKELKIQKRYLQAMEEGDFSVFAGEVYARGALRNYAEAIGLNQNEIVSFYDQYLKFEDIDRTGTIDMTKKKKKVNKPGSRKTKKTLPFVILVWFALLLFIVGGSIWYRYQPAAEENGGKNPPETNPTGWEGSLSPEGIPPPENITPTGSENTPPNDPDPIPEPELTLLSNDNRKFIYMLTGTENVEIALEFTGRCWVGVKNEGLSQQENTRNYEAGEKLYLGDSTETEIRLGNPSVTKIKVNGLELTGYGKSGYAVNIVVKKGN